MKTLLQSFIKIAKPLTLAIMTIGSTFALASGLDPIVDDFSDVTNNNLGHPRHFVDDTSAGGATRTQTNIANGIMHITGEIVPPRGQPGWASSVLLLDPQGLATDVSQFEGVRLRLKISSGTLSVSANSNLITNFDYHAAPVVVTSDGQFHDVKIPFNSMRRAWSEQVPLDTTTLSSLSIVAFSMQKASVDFEVDEVSFY